MAQISKQDREFLANLEAEIKAALKEFRRQTSLIKTDQRYSETYKSQQIQRLRDALKGKLTAWQDHLSEIRQLLDQPLNPWPSLPQDPAELIRLSALANLLAQQQNIDEIVRRGSTEIWQAVVMLRPYLELTHKWDVIEAAARAKRIESDFEFAEAERERQDLLKAAIRALHNLRMAEEALQAPEREVFLAADDSKVEAV